MLAGAFFSGIALFSKRPHWSLAPPEQTELGEAIGGVMPQMSPAAVKALGQASPWIRLALVAGTIVTNRAAIDASYQQPQKPNLTVVPRAQQQPQQQRKASPDVLFPEPPRPREQPQTAAAAASDLPAIFRGETPTQSPIVGMTTGGGGGGVGQHTAPSPEVPGLHDDAFVVPNAAASAIMQTRAGNEAGELGTHTAPLPEVPGVNV